MKKIFALLFVVAFLMSISTVGATWWNNNWDYKKQIDFTADNGNFTTFIVPYNSKMNSDFSDLRFVNSVEDTELNFTIREKTNSDYALVSVHSEGADYIYMYYNNSAAGSSENINDTWFNASTIYYADGLTGDMKDSVLGNDGTVTGATKGAVGEINNTLTYDGTNDQVRPSTLQAEYVGVTEYSISLWANSDSFGDGDFSMIVDDVYDSSGNPNVKIGIDPRVGAGYNNLRIKTTGINGVGALDYNLDMQTNTWYQIAVVVTQADTKLYINGDEKTSASASSGSYHSGNYGYTIGNENKDGTNYGNYWDGEIDEVFMWKKELTADEVYQIYTSTEPTVSFGSEETSSSVSITDLTESPASPQTYPVNQINFSANVTGTPTLTIDTVYFQNNFSGSFVNNTPSTSGTIYTYEINNPAANTYKYRWFAIDNESNVYSSTQQTYTINKAPATVSVLLNGTAENLNLNYGNTTSAQATVNISELTPTLYLNGSEVANPDIKQLSGGYWNYTAALNHENYTATPATHFITINKISPDLNLTANNWTLLNYQTSTITGSNCPSQLTCKLYRDGANISNPDVQELAAGTYTYVFNTTGNENYTAQSLTENLTLLYTALRINTYDEQTLQKFTNNLSYTFFNQSKQWQIITYGEYESNTANENLVVTNPENIKDHDKTTYTQINNPSSDSTFGTTYYVGSGSATQSQTKVCYLYEQVSSSGSTTITVKAKNTATGTFETLDTMGTSTTTPKTEHCFTYNNTNNKYSETTNMSISATLHTVGTTDETINIYEIYNPYFTDGSFNYSTAVSQMPTGENTNIKVESVTGTYYAANYYLNITQSTNGTLNTYLTPTSISTAVGVYLKDDAYNAVPNAVIYIQEFKNDQYVTTSEILTDYEGKGVSYLQLYDTYYRFVVYKDGNVILTTKPLVLTSATVNLYTGSTETSDWLGFTENYKYSCVLNNETSVLRCELLDTSGLVSSATLKVQKKNNLVWDTLCDNTSEAIPTTITCSLGNTTGNLYYYKFTANMNNQDYLVYSENLDYTTSDIDMDWGTTGILIALLVLGSLLFVATTPVVAIGFVFLGVVVLYFVNVISMPLTAIIGLGVAVGVIIWSMMKSK